MTKSEEDKAAAEFEARRKSLEENHVPDPLGQTGSVITNGSAGDGAGRIEDLAPVFAQSRAQALEAAVEELDDDEPVSTDHVVLPEAEADKSNEDAVADLKASAKAARKDADAQVNGKDDGKKHTSG